ncbi:MAG TPA: phage holin family protein [Gaiellaceae bacterium]|nr:phage holin family protein [Gaiellaceae bacterium]
MAARTGRRLGLGEAARRVSGHATALARLEARLALHEVRRKTASLVGAAVSLVAAAAFGGLALLCAVAGAAAAIALVLPVWAAVLIVAGGLLLLAGPLAVVGLVLLRGAALPLPEQALEEARLTSRALRDGRV